MRNRGINMLTNWIIGVFLITRVGGTLDPAGTKCGQKRCSTTEYCSPYDTQCRPCATACDTSSHNYQEEICVKDCQEFLHDQRYVLRGELGRDVVSRDYGQSTLIHVSLVISLISFVGVFCLYLGMILKGKRLRGVWKKFFGTRWTKKKINKIRDDVEAGPPKHQNGLKLTMPTISRSVAAASQGHGTNVSTSSTPNTTSTPLSRRHPSEDTTLDYAYDNPAMTPSPETATAKSKKESSF
ncbi:uncharacterized protein grnd [Fopius arisanus]|uniref:Uncharacterized protein grnd n=1 Tax=Fopius arisanus TaxID=64838 RepID=A0A9R1TDE1_9HYME|nr:PREDICTED: uncharacterized protein LOC105268932 [Fopius arisanus]XP_011307171.1 PREDICTED: uncharacterized protein LOC105268932 [Fopius arisanus]